MAKTIIEIDGKKIEVEISKNGKGAISKSGGVDLYKLTGIEGIPNQPSVGWNSKKNNKAYLTKPQIQDWLQGLVRSDKEVSITGPLASQFSSALQSSTNAASAAPAAKQSETRSGVQGPNLYENMIRISLEECKKTYQIEPHQQGFTDIFLATFVTKTKGNNLELDDVFKQTLMRVLQEEENERVATPNTTKVAANQTPEKKAGAFITRYNNNYSNKASVNLGAAESTLKARLKKLEEEKKPLLPARNQKSELEVAIEDLTLGGGVQYEATNGESVYITKIASSDPAHKGGFCYQVYAESHMADIDNQKNYKYMGSIREIFTQYKPNLNEDFSVSEGQRPDKRLGTVSKGQITGLIERWNEGNDTDQVIEVKAGNDKYILSAHSTYDPDIQDVDTTYRIQNMQTGEIRERFPSPRAALSALNIQMDPNNCAICSIKSVEAVAPPLIYTQVLHEETGRQSAIPKQQQEAHVTYSSLDAAATARLRKS